MSHGAAVLTGSLAELCGNLVLDHALLVPAVDRAKAILFLVLRSLMFEGRLTKTHIPRSLRDVLRNVWIDVSVKSSQKSCEYSVHVDHVRVILYLCYYVKQ